MPPKTILAHLGPLARNHPDAIAHFLRSIVESSDDAILTKDLNGIITTWNRGAPADNHSLEYWNAGSVLSPSFVPPGSTILLSANLRLS